MTEGQTEPSFEELLKQLQQVAHELSNGDLPLNQSLQLYEKGVELTRKCETLLQRAETQIKELSKKDSELGVREQPFQK